MKFLQGARLLQIICRSCYQGTLSSTKGNLTHSKTSYVLFPEQKYFNRFLINFSSKPKSLCQRCTIVLESEIPLRASEVITMKYFNQIPVFADLRFAFIRDIDG